MANGFVASPTGICHITRDEKNAMQGTFGVPNDTNRYLTTSDSRVAPASDTNAGTMSAHDFRLLHGLSVGDLSTLTDMDMSLLAEMASRVIYDEKSSALGLLNVNQYMSIETYTDGYSCPGSITSNLSRNKGKLVLKPDTAATTITLMDDCAAELPLWQEYNPAGISFTYGTEYWDLVGQNALKQSMVNAGVVTDSAYLIIATHRALPVSDVYGILVTTKVSSDNNPIVAGVNNSRSKCVKQEKHGGDSYASDAYCKKCFAA